MASSDEPVRAVDLFCGAGGLSTGLALACEDLDRDVKLAAVNHWDIAIETHEQNHPWADHYHSGVKALKPIEVFLEGDIDILIAAPSCTDHSKARGGQPVNPQDRMSPFAILDWIAQLRPRSVLIENVPEFKQWGPVIDGQPTRNAQFFEAWTHTMEGEDGLGYTVSHRELTAADYGDPTSRKRLFIVARRDDAPVWPDPSHSETGDQPGTEVWRSAAEIIDWSERGQSIWTRGLQGNGKVPLAANTMQRIAQGIRRYGHDDLEPFADAISALGKDEVRDLQDDVVPVSEVADAVAERKEPFLVKAEVVAPDPDADRTYEDGVGLCPPTIKGQHGGSVPRDAAEEPVQTVTTDGNIQIYEPETFVLPRNQVYGDLHSNASYDPEDRPLHTVTAQNHDGHLVTPYLVPYYGERDGQKPRTHALDDPLPTVTATGSDPYLATPYLTVYNGQSDAADVEDPLPTVTTRDRFGLVLPELYPWGLDVRYRMLQPRELAAAQGFPDDYEFAGGTKKAVTEQIGNAVPVNLATALCRQLLEGGGPTLETYTSPEGVVSDD
jgi:DNA (cytosine-5)-methyltransferase 1